MAKGPARWRGAACVGHLRGGRRQQREGRPGVAALGRRLHLLTWQAEAEVLACHTISTCMQPGVQSCSAINRRHTRLALVS